MSIDPQIKADGLYFLKRNSLFSPLGEEVLSELVAFLKPTSLSKDAVLVHEGDPGEALYLVRSGRVRVVSKNAKGEEKTVAYLSRGDSIGELALLTGEPHAITVTTDSPCDFLVLHKTDFDHILETHPLIGIHLSRALSRRLAVSFHPPQDRPKVPQLIGLIPGLPHEASLLFTVNMAIALVEQTRRKVVLLDLSPRSGDMARALGLTPTLSADGLFSAEGLQNMEILQHLLAIHPSGLEILSLPPRIFSSDRLSALPALFSILRDHYDFTLVLVSPEKDPIAQTLLREVDKTLFVTWDQAPDLAQNAHVALDENSGASSAPIVSIYLQDPATLGTGHVDFRVPWSETFHEPFRASGSPYLNISQAVPALAALNRIARALGKLRVGVAMGSGAAYGYALIGILKVFEREGIPVDLVSGTSMGSLLGSFYCAGNSPQRIQEIASGITRRWLWENILGDLTFPHSGFLAGQTLNGFLRSILGLVEFHQLLIPFASVATDIRSGHEVVIQEGRVVDAVRASTSLPILFQPFLYKGRYLLDGGLVNPVPTSTIANMGADILISVNLTAKPSVRRGLGRYRRVFPLAPRSPYMTEVFFKMIYTMQYEIAQARTEIAHVVIAPDMRDFLWTDFHRSEEILKIGEAAAEEAVAKIKSLLPYFSDYCRVPLDINFKAY